MVPDRRGVQVDVAALVARSGELKRELVAYAMRGPLAKELTAVLDAQVPDLDQLPGVGRAYLIDRFLLEHRLRDGRTPVERFVRARGELPRPERDMLLGWRDVVPGCFEVQQVDGQVMVTVNLVDELTYRIRSNMGVDAIPGLQTGAFLQARVVPVLDEWLISGTLSVKAPAERDAAFEYGLSLVKERPDLPLRNPDLLAAAWRRQSEDREAFVSFFGTDEVILPRDQAEQRWAQYWRAEHGDDAPPPPSLPPGGESVGLVHDPEYGLNMLVDYAAFRESFQHPELVRRPRYRIVVVGYLTDADVSPVPFRRCALAWPDGADAVLAAVTRRPKFSWARDGEDLMRRHKPTHVDRPARPFFTTLGALLSDWAKNGPAQDPASAQDPTSAQDPASAHEAAPAQLESPR
jgi:hypothetical protein